MTDTKERLRDQRRPRQVLLERAADAATSSAPRSSMPDTIGWTFTSMPSPGVGTYWVR